MPMRQWTRWESNPGPTTLLAPFVHVCSRLFSGVDPLSDYRSATIPTNLRMAHGGPADPSSCNYAGGATRAPSSTDGTQAAFRAGASYGIALSFAIDVALLNGVGAITRRMGTRVAVEADRAQIAGKNRPFETKC